MTKDEGRIASTCATGNRDPVSTVYGTDKLTIE